MTPCYCCRRAVSHERVLVVFAAGDAGPGYSRYAHPSCASAAGIPPVDLAATSVVPPRARES